MIYTITITATRYHQPPVSQFGPVEHFTWFAKSINSISGVPSTPIPSGWIEEEGGSSIHYLADVVLPDFLEDGGEYHHLRMPGVKGTDGNADLAFVIADVAAKADTPEDAINSAYKAGWTLITPDGKRTSVKPYNLRPAP